jgi:hypothetical protein
VIHLPNLFTRLRFEVKDDNVEDETIADKEVDCGERDEEGTEEDVAVTDKEVGCGVEDTEEIEDEDCKKDEVVLDNDDETSFR